MIDLNNIHRVLVIILRHHGDVLLTSPIFSTLKQHYPHIRIDALVYRETMPMLVHHPAVTLVHTIDRNWRNAGFRTQLRGYFHLLRTMSACNYDLTLHLTTHWAGAWVNRILRPRFALVPDFQKVKRSSFIWRSNFTDFYPYNSTPERHTVEKNLDALRYLRVEGVDNVCLTLRAPETSYAQVREKMLKQNWQGGRFAVVHPGSRWPSKCWQPEKVARVIEYLSDRDFEVVLSAAPDSAELTMVTEILYHLNSSIRLVNLSGQLSLTELAALIDGADLHFGVDSVPMHIAAAMQTPVVALFGPSNLLEWAPWRSNACVVTSRDFALTEMQQAATGRYRYTLDNIPVDVVISAIDYRLNPENKANLLVKVSVCNGEICAEPLPLVNSEIST